MRRFLTTVLLAAVVGVVAAAPAQARTCGGTEYYEVYKVRGGVPCAKAKKVIAAHFDDRPTSGFRCREKDTPTTLVVCRKGAKKITYASE